MELQSFAYVGLRTSNLEDWANVGVKLYGLQLTERTKSTLTFRMDDRRQRIVVHDDGGQGAAFIGFDVADAAALGAVAAKLESRGVPIIRFTRTLADERRVEDGIAFADPAGNRVEVFHGPEVAADPFKPGRTMSGFRAGPLGVGHMVFNVERVEPMVAFYGDVLGLRLSDYFLKPVKIYFMHVNSRHHTIAFLENPNRSVHHMMIETFMLDDVGQGYDLALQEEGRVAQTLGRHINDQMTSYYSNTPSGFMLEYGWGGRTIDPDTWTPEEVTYGPSLWGHERLWLPPEGREVSRALRVRAAADGLRAPVNVIEGNYALAPGTCPWFDAVRKSGSK